MLHYLIETYGCQMNVADSAEVESEFKKHGWTMTSDPLSADMIVINTCSVRRTAEERIEGRLGYFKNLKSKRKFQLAVMGCFAQKDGEALKKKYPFINYIIGTRNKSIFSEILSPQAKPVAYKKSKVFTNIKNQIDYLEPSLDPEFAGRGFISVIKGCNNFCSYCIVPYTRGREISIPSKDILEEVKKLAQKGAVEIYLMGQNVNSYGKDIQDISFAKLLNQIAEIKEIQRVKFMTSHPKDFSDELVESVCYNPKISKSAHLPLQSASNKILQLMNRVYSFSDYMKIIDKLKTNYPMIALSTDILLGFPGETQEDFQKTYQAIKEIEFDKSFIFMYSPREGTTAYNIQETLDYTEKQNRVQAALDLQHQISKKKSERFLNQMTHVMVESAGKKNPSEITGLNEYEYRVFFKGTTNDIGKLIPVKITEIKGFSLIGEKI